MSKRPHPASNPQSPETKNQQRRKTREFSNPSESSATASSILTRHQKAALAVQNASAGLRKSQRSRYLPMTGRRLRGVVDTSDDESYAPSDDCEDEEISSTEQSDPNSEAMDGPNHLSENGFNNQRGPSNEGAAKKDDVDPGVPEERVKVEEVHPDEGFQAAGYVVLRKKMEEAATLSADLQQSTNEVLETLSQLQLDMERITRLSHKVMKRQREINTLASSYLPPVSIPVKKQKEEPVNVKLGWTEPASGNTPVSPS